MDLGTVRISMHIMAEVGSDEDIMRHLVCRQVCCEGGIGLGVFCAILAVFARRVAGHIVKKDKWVVFRRVWEAADGRTEASLGAYVLLVCHPGDGSRVFDLRHQMIFAGGAVQG